MAGTESDSERAQDEDPGAPQSDATDAITRYAEAQQLAFSKGTVLLDRIKAADAMLGLATKASPDDPGWAQRMAWCAWLAGMIDLADASGLPLQPARHMLSALRDLDAGLGPSMFVVKSEGGGRRKPIAIAKQHGAAAAAVELLVVDGGMTQKGAVERVAKLIRHWPAVQRLRPGRDAAKSVIEWRERAAYGEPDKQDDAAACKVARDTTREIMKAFGLSAEEAVERLLLGLASTARMESE